MTKIFKYLWREYLSLFSIFFPNNDMTLAQDFLEKKRELVRNKPKYRLRFHNKVSLCHYLRAG